MIVRQLSQAEFAKRMSQTKKAKAEEWNRQAQKREEAERLAQEQRAQEAIKAFMGSSPLATAVEELEKKLRAEREETTKKGLHRRLENGRWISRDEQAEAIATANALESRGF